MSTENECSGNLQREMARDLVTIADVSEHGLVRMVGAYGGFSPGLVHGAARGETAAAGRTLKVEHAPDAGVEP